MAPVSLTGRTVSHKPARQDLISGCKKFVLSSDVVVETLPEFKQQFNPTVTPCDYRRAEERIMTMASDRHEICDQGNTGASQGYSLAKCIEYTYYVVREQESKDLTVPKPNRKQRRAALSDSRRKNKRGR